jgi:alpha-D-xyloside xylohydrolase
MKYLLFLSLMALTCFSCAGPGWQTDDAALTVFPRTGEAKMVRVEPFSDEIIRVTSTPDQLVNNESLVVLPKAGNVPFEVAESAGLVVLSTAAVTVEVSKETGVVCFLDTDGNVILQEKDKGGKVFKAMQVDGVKGYELQQVFESSDQEALYGLGQHQAHEMNYKGKNEELFQYNTKVSIPFIVSTKNYGVLWDNYSFSRFGDPRPYGQMSQFKLFNKEGQEGALTATYVDDLTTKHVFAVRQEKTIDYENLETINNFPQGFDFSNAEIIWEGEIEPSESGLFHFLLYYAGYTKIWIDGVLMADRWRTAWNPSVAKFQIKMEAGRKYPVKLEWIPDGGVSYIGLKALSPRSPELQNDISFYSEMGDQIDYYFMKGNNMDGVISNYRELTGKAQVMPRWAMGFWQSRERYKTQDELLNTLSEFRKRRIPIDNIVQDWSYWPVDQWGSHDFDPDRFPDPKAMVDKVHEMNGHIMISVWPKFYPTTDNYKAFDAKGWMYKQAIEDSILDWIAPGHMGSFYDAYAPGAREIFWQQIRDKLYNIGMDAWWLDATEPDILSNASMAYRKALMNPTYYGPSTKYFNAFALMNAKGIYEGQRRDGNNERVFILTRSGFAGMQRYGTVTWSGDIGTVWEDMKAQIPAGINFSMSGLPYWTMDIGGFCVEKRYESAKEGSDDMNEWRELNTRWFQFGAFAPLFRVHGQYPLREMYNLAPVSHPAYKSMLYYDRLRYRLMPYIYSLTGAVWFDNYTIMRGLAMDFTNDANVYDIDDQYMFGPSLMVCPVYKYKARNRDVYFPAGKGWYDFYSGEFQIGGVHKSVEAPYERMPVFVPEGAIITAGPEVQYASQKEADLITVYVYTGADGAFKLYEDEGVNYNYEDGRYAVIPMAYDDTLKSLTIGDRMGEFNGMLQARKFLVVFVSKDNPAGFNPELAKGTLVEYNGKSINVKLK